MKRKSRPKKEMQTYDRKTASMKSNQIFAQLIKTETGIVIPPGIAMLSDLIHNFEKCKPKIKKYAPSWTRPAK